MPSASTKAWRALCPHVLGSSLLWLRLYSALQGNYCDLESCDSCAGSDMRQSNKVLLIIDIHGLTGPAHYLTYIFKCMQAQTPGK